MDNLLSTLYPVGSIYIGTQNSCPLATLIAGSQWQIVSNGRALWGGNGMNANTTIEAGLPNITGSFSTASDKNLGTGAFSWTNNKYATNGGGKGGQYEINFNASRSSSIYGKSSTVQPPAYIVNIWKRTA